MEKEVIIQNQSGAKRYQNPMVRPDPLDTVHLGQADTTMYQASHGADMRSQVQQ